MEVMMKVTTESMQQFVGGIVEHVYFVFNSAYVSRAKIEGITVDAGCTLRLTTSEFRWCAYAEREGSFNWRKAPEPPTRLYQMWHDAVEINPDDGSVPLILGDAPTLYTFMPPE